MRIKITLIFVLCLFTRMTIAQNLSIQQTIDYINKKLADNPYHTYDFTDSFSIELNSNGELSIIRKYKSGSDPWKTSTTSFIASDVSLTTNCFSDGDSKSCLSTLLYLYNIERTLIFYCKSSCIKTVGVQNDTKWACFQTMAVTESIRESLCNAFNSLFQKISVDPRFKKSKDNDPFSNENYNNTTFNSTGSNETIRMIKMEGGTYQIPVTINDVLKISFIFDSGASDVSISPDVALTLIRTGTVKESDFIGSQTYSFADGSTATSQRFIIKKLSIGNHIVTNVVASISNSIKAPMLLGQSVQQKFGKIIIDNSSHIIKFEN